MNKSQLKHREPKIISIIAASENIGHAATVLGIVQANVSKYLADFGSKVGLKALGRTTRQLIFTPFDIALLPYINDMLDRNEQLSNFIADYKHEKRGKITVCAPASIITYLSQHVIAKIQNISDISLSLKTCNLERKAFYEGVDFPDDCDVLITYAHPKDKSLIASFITKYAVTAFASPEYIKEHPIKSPDKLEGHFCILTDSVIIDDTNIWRFTFVGSKEVHNYRMTGNYVCDDTQSALVLARNHLGIVFAPNASVQRDVQSGLLVPCSSEQHEWWLDSVAIPRKREYQPRRVQFIPDEMLAEIRQQLTQSLEQQTEQAEWSASNGRDTGNAPSWLSIVRPCV